MYAQLNLKTDTKNLSCFSLFFYFYARNFKFLIVSLFRFNCPEKEE